MRNIYKALLKKLNRLIHRHQRERVCTVWMVVHFINSSLEAHIGRDDNGSENYDGWRGSMFFHNWEPAELLAQALLRFPAHLYFSNPWFQRDVTHFISFSISIISLQILSQNLKTLFYFLAWLFTERKMASVAWSLTVHKVLHSAHPISYILLLHSLDVHTIIVLA